MQSQDQNNPETRAESNRKLVPMRFESTEGRKPELAPADYQPMTDNGPMVYDDQVSSLPPGTPWRVYFAMGTNRNFFVTTDEQAGLHFVEQTSMGGQYTACSSSPAPGYHETFDDARDAFYYAGEKMDGRHPDLKAISMERNKMQRPNYVAYKVMWDQETGPTINEMANTLESLPEADLEKDYATDMLYEAPILWEGWREEMEMASGMWPGTVFSVTENPEGKQATRLTYFRDGASYQVTLITQPPFDPDRLGGQDDPFQDDPFQDETE